MDDAARKINERMMACLKRSDFDGFFQVAVRDLRPRLIGDLVKNMRLSIEDAEDCVFDVLKNIYIRCNDGDMPQLESPSNYLWRASKNRALNLIDRRRKETKQQGDAEYLAGHGLRGYRSVARSLSEHDSVRSDVRGSAITGTHRAVLLSPLAATVLAEGLLDETEPDPSRLVEMVQLALSRLSRVNAEVIEYQMNNGFDSKLVDGARQLGLLPATFRKRKERAYAELRVQIVTAMSELGLERRRYADDIREEQLFEFPSSEENEAD